MNNIFIKSEQLGIIASMLEETEKEAVKRKRQTAFKDSVQTLKLTKLIAKDAKVAGFGKGVNALGDRGFWVVLETYTGVKAEGPQIAPRPHDRCSEVREGDDQCQLKQGHDGDHLFCERTL